jgi:Protein of unknown function (DUF1640).
MTAITFNTHNFVKKLKAAGFSEEQAEAQAEAIAEVVEEPAIQVATKRDMEDLKSFVLNQNDKLIIKFGAMLAGAVIIIGALIKII